MSPARLSLATLALASCVTACAPVAPYQRGGRDDHGSSAFTTMGPSPRLGGKRLEHDTLEPFGEDRWSTTWTYGQADLLEWLRDRDARGPLWVVPL